jgi:hypothetical protein
MRRLTALLQGELHLIGSAVGFGDRLLVAACWQPGISRPTFVVAEIADGEPSFPSALSGD